MHFQKNEISKILIILLCISVMIVLVVINGAKPFYENINIKDKFYKGILEVSLPMKYNESIADSNELNVTNNLLNNALKGNTLNIIGREISILSPYINENNKFNIDFGEHQFDRFVLKDDQVVEEENKTSNSVDMSSATAFNPELKKEMSKKPEVLIYHTHTCESYKPYGTNIVEKDKNVVAVGEELKKELEKYGISTVHDTTIHDLDTYDKSYERSRVTLDKYLKENKEFKLVIDMHRDSIENKAAVTTTINGENVARFMFVMAKKSPNFNENSKLVEKIRDISNKLYPGDKENSSFNKGTFYYNYGRKYFNQDSSKNAVLIEVGSHVNTLDEAKASAKYLARIFAEEINGKK